MKEAVKVKLCGLRRKEDIDYVNEYQPNYIGFVFAESKRKVSKETAKELAEQLHKGIKKVGVFVNEDIESLAETASVVSLDVIQLHGDEDESYITELRKRLKELNSKRQNVKNIELWKAIRVKDKESIILAAKSSCDKVLLDAYKEGVYGGTGKTIDLSLIHEFKKISKKPFFVAGGINSSNVKEVIKLANPYGVDISSGIETEGYKDKNKIKQIMKTIQGVNKDE